MQKNNSNIFSEKELDNLLNRSFLESYLTKPKNEKISEAIAAHVFGLNTAVLSNQRSFFKKLIRKISLPNLLLFMIITSSFSIGAYIINTNKSESKKNNISNYKSAIPSNQPPSKINNIQSTMSKVTLKKERRMDAPVHSIVKTDSIGNIPNTYPIKYIYVTTETCELNIIPNESNFYFQAGNDTIFNKIKKAKADLQEIEFPYPYKPRLNHNGIKR